jgi:hypothetical protein
MLKHKNDVLPVFHKCVTLVQTQFFMGIKTLQSDNECEYISQRV